MKEFISFVGALHMTTDIIKTKWKSLLLVVAPMFCAAALVAAVFNFSSFDSYGILFFYVWRAVLSFLPYIAALFYGFVFICYIVENCFRDKKDEFRGALEYFKARLRNYSFAVWFFILLAGVLLVATISLGKLLLLAVIIILFRFIYAFFAAAFLNCDVVSALKSSARLTKGFRFEIFMRSAMIIFFEYFLARVAFLCASVFDYSYYANILIVILALVYFVIFQSVMFLSLFNLKQSNL